VGSVFPLTEISQVIHEAVASLALPPSFFSLLLLPLQQPGKVLHSADDVPLWPAIVLATGVATGADPRIAIRVAAANEIFMAGLDVLDEVEDNDQSTLIDVAGVPRAINTGTALLLIAQRLLLTLPAHGAPIEQSIALTSILTEAGIHATGGQDTDLATSTGQQTSSAEALAIARAKSGALVAGTAKLGARVGTADPALLALYHQWGEHFGTLLQIANDIGDATSETKSDAAQRKATLPLIFARGEEREGASNVTQETLKKSGAFHFAWVVREIERQHCESLLVDLAARGQRVDRLHALLAWLG